MVLLRREERNGGECGGENVPENVVRDQGQIQGVQ